MTNHSVMIRFGRVHLAALAALAISLVAGSAPLQAQSSGDIVNALKPATAPSSGAGLTRSLTAPSAAAPADPRTPAQRNLINTLRTRSISVEAVGAPTADDRAQVAEIAKTSPAIDLAILFDYNSATVSAAAMPTVVKLGMALSDPSLKGSVFLINGHTDAAGSAEYNLGLSQRRADAVRRVLIESFQLPPTSLIAVGFGKEQLKNPNNPLADENRRVQIVNTNVTAGR